MKPKRYGGSLYLRLSKKEYIDPNGFDENTEFNVNISQDKLVITPVKEESNNLSEDELMFLRIFESKNKVRLSKANLFTIFCGKSSHKTQKQHEMKEIILSLIQKGFLTPNSYRGPYVGLIL